MPETLTQPEPAVPAYTGPVVAFEDVSLAFDHKVILKNISFSVDRGQTLIILGPPDTGSIRIFGQEITTMPERDLYKLRAQIGMVFQESALFDSLNVEDNIAYRLNEEHIQ